MFKKIISAGLALSMVFGGAALLPEGFSAQSGITVKAAQAQSGKCGENVTWSYDGKGTLTISGNGDMYDYEYASPFRAFDGLNTVIIKNGVTSIGEYSFCGCIYLTSIKIPNSITSIGDFSFCECPSLTSIKIPSSVKSIGASGFTRCTSLTSITIPDSVKSIGKYTFCGCINLTSITIPEGVTSIGEGTFVSCSNLTSVTIPDSVTSIGEGAFNYCTSLASIKIPNSVTRIGNGAFSVCTSLTSLTIPNGITSIGEYTFYRCTSLKSLTIPKSVKSIEPYSVGFYEINHIDDNGHYNTEGNWIKQKGFTLYCYPGSKAEKYANEYGIKYKYAMNYSKVTLGKSSYVFTGKSIKPTSTVKFGTKTLKAGTDYTVSYKNNKNCGKATVTVTGKGSYTGSVTKTFIIKPKKAAVKKLTSPKTKQLKVTLKQSAGSVTGYQIKYSTSKKFAGSKTKSVSTTKTSKTIKSLKKGKTYYIKVRAYKTVGSKKYYGKYSDVMKLKIK